MWFFGFISSIGIYSMVKGTVISPPNIVVIAVANFLALVCMFLYAYNKKWLPSNFWKIFLFAYTAWLTYNSVHLFFSGKTFSDVGGALFGIVLFIPVSFAAYQIGFKRES